MVIRVIQTLTFRNLRIVPEFLGTNGLVIGRNNSRIKVETVTIEDFMDEGLLIAASNTAIEINNAVIRSNGNAGVILNESSEVLLQNSLISGNGSSFVGKPKNALGLVIQRSSRNLQKKIKIQNTQILFNLGSLDTQFDSDLDVLGKAVFENVLTTGGTEGSGIRKWDDSKLMLNASRVSQFLAKQPENLRRFLSYYIEVQSLAISDEPLGASNYAFIREYQMDQCLAAKLGDSMKEIIIDAIHAAIGNRPEHLQKFLERHRDADQSLTVTAYPGFCDQFFF